MRAICKKGHQCSLCLLTSKASPSPSIPSVTGARTICGVGVVWCACACVCVCMCVCVIKSPHLK